MSSVGSGSTARSSRRTWVRLNTTGAARRWWSAAGGSRHTGGSTCAGSPAGPPSLVQTLPHPNQDVMRQDDQRHVVMPAPPRAYFVVVEADIAFTLRKA